MNERIKEIELQCYVTLTKAGLDGKAAKQSTIFDKEKFAELIVKECARTAALFSIENKRIHPDIDPRDMPSANHLVYHSTCQSVALAIKEQFGVKE